MFLDPVVRSQPNITFDAERHLYTVEGAVLPSVTQIIQSEYPAFYLDNGARERGTILHKMFEDYDNGVIDEDDIRMFYGEDYLVYFEQYLEFLGDYSPRGISCEIRVANLELGYCGTIDRSWELFLGVDYLDCISDLKTGSAVSPWWRLQTAAYAMALFDNPESVVRMVLHIHPKKLKKYKLHSYHDRSDFSEWTALCNRYHYQIKQMEEIAR